jgi:hypothetical protein
MMAIRQPAAEKLVRQLLELKLTRINKLSDKFISAMAKIVITHVDIDEQHARAEKLQERSAAVNTENGEKK